MTYQKDTDWAQISTYKRVRLVVEWERGKPAPVWQDYATVLSLMRGLIDQGRFLLGQVYHVGCDVNGVPATVKCCFFGHSDVGFTRYKSETMH